MTTIALNDLLTSQRKLKCVSNHNYLSAQHEVNLFVILWMFFKQFLSSYNVFNIRLCLILCVFASLCLCVIVHICHFRVYLCIACSCFLFFCFDCVVCVFEWVCCVCACGRAYCYFLFPNMPSLQPGLWFSFAWSRDFQW